jgi:rhodanese-related sulfurtransferase
MRSLSDMLRALFLSALLACTASSVQAADAADVPEKWHTPFGLYLSAVEAREMKQEQGGAVAFIDVRTRAELKYIGAPQEIDVNIPLRFFQTERWNDKQKTFSTDSNKQFVDDVLAWLATRGGDRETPIILICLSGSRSPIAARQLHEAGFKRVYTLHEGFEGVKAESGEQVGQRVVNGWKNADLPWSYKLDHAKMYDPEGWRKQALPTK